jgi:hypothetical protein
MTLLSKSALSERIAKFGSRDLGLLWRQAAILLAIDVLQQMLARWALTGGDNSVLEPASYALLFASFAVLAWLGFDVVVRANGTAFTAIVAGAIFSFAAAALGFVAYFVSGGPFFGLDALVFSLGVSSALGGVFSGIGGVVARLKSGFWLKH